MTNNNFCISGAMLSLQKERFFESKRAQYWNASKRDERCPVLDDSKVGKGHKAKRLVQTPLRLVQTPLRLAQTKVILL